MKSKISSLIIISAFFPLWICSAADSDIRTVSAKLESATVFRKGAELIHTTKTALTKGDNELYIEGLSPNIDENSLKISIPDGVTVVSHSFSQNHLANQPADATVKCLQDSIDRYNKELVLINTKLQINEDLIQLLKANNSIGGTQSGVSVNELIKMMDYYKSKSTELNNEIATFTARKKELSEKINSFTRQRDSEKRKNDKVSGRLHLKLISPATGNFSVTVGYYTDHASWEPCYDLQMNGTDKPLKIVYKADIRQTTGLDWDKVNLTLSTVIPSNGKVAPMPQAWFLQYVMAASTKSMNAAPMQNTLSYELQGRVAGVAVEQDAPIMIRGTSKSADTQPLYIVNGESVSSEYLSSLDPNSIKSMEVLKDAAATSVYGSRGVNGVVLITLKSGMEDYVITSESEIDVTYKIDLPYTIAGNGNPQNVVLRSAETEAEYRYYCAPKLDRAVFLTASIKNREKLNLLPGKANITIEGSYTGTTYIDPDNTRETLDLTLGQDNRVTVKREKMQDMSSVRFLGSDVRQEFAYRISVINTKAAPVRMIVKDQYPLSTQKEIVVEVLGFTGKPHENKEIGTLTWEFELAPGKTESFDLRYSVKYPRGRSLNL
jgi:TonB-dependent SusC/RagA subfamily outer membrane receptor